MTPQVWRPTPQFQIIVGSTTYTVDEAINLILSRPENNVSSLVMTLNDYKSKNYVGIFDTLDQVTVKFRYGKDSWTSVFSGRVYDAKPMISSAGEYLTVSCWGLEQSLLKTYCDTSFGIESQRNPTIDTPYDIISKIVDYVDYAYGNILQDTGYNMSIAKVEDVHNDLSVTYINSNYMDNFSLLSRLCDLVNAHAQAEAEAGIHWYVDPSNRLYVKKIDADHSDGNWDKYWGGTSGTNPGTAASSTIVVKKDMIRYDFRKHVEDYSNDVVLASAFRLPAEDVLCEYSGVGTQGGSYKWGNNGQVSLTNVQANPTPIVGSYCLGAMHTVLGDGVAQFYYPSSQTAGWDFKYFTSPKTPAFLSFYAMRNQDWGATPWYVRLHTNANDYFEPYLALNTQIGIDNLWTLQKYPVGPYNEKWADSYGMRWDNPTGNASWNNINYIAFAKGHEHTNEMFIDDLHFSGTVMRRAYDDEDYATNRCHQITLLNNTAISDSLVASDDSGTIAQLAYSEYKRRKQTPTVGIIETPLIVDILPGQTVHIHACQKTDGTYRVDMDMRVKEVKHTIHLPYPSTTLNLTSDVLNSNAFAAPSIISLLQEYVGGLGMMEAQDLKGGSMDNLIPRLEKDY